MAIDRTRAGITILRVCLGVFFVFEGIGKLRWLADSSVLSAQLASWAQAPTGSISHWYLNRIAQPGVFYLARLVPLGELVSGVAFITFFMALNFQIASGALFEYSFLTSGYGLPVLGGALALTFAGGSRKTKSAATPRRTG